jgi:hypothetical protein
MGVLTMCHTNKTIKGDTFQTIPMRQSSLWQGHFVNVPACFQLMVPTLCNQLLSHLLSHILQTLSLHNCYENIENVYATFWKCSDIFRKIYMKLNLVIFSSPELKVQVSFSDRLLSVVHPSDVCLIDFYIFNFFSRTAGPILTKDGTNLP